MQHLIYHADPQAYEEEAEQEAEDSCTKLLALKFSKGDLPIPQKEVQYKELQRGKREIPSYRGSEKYFLHLQYLILSPMYYHSYKVQSELSSFISHVSRGETDEEI